MNEIIAILMRRDHISELEARNLVEECRDEILAACEEGHYEEAEDILADYLGIEPDYLMYIL